MHVLRSLHALPETFCVLKPAVGLVFSSIQHSPLSSEVASIMSRRQQRQNSAWLHTYTVAAHRSKPPGEHFHPPSFLLVSPIEFGRFSPNGCLYCRPIELTMTRRTTTSSSIQRHKDCNCPACLFWLPTQLCFLMSSNSDPSKLS